MSRAIRLFAVLAFCALPLVAADEWCPTRAYRMFGKAQWRGLPQSSVVAMAQDADGVLWIGTLDGAATFDGREITPVPDVPGAPVRGLIGTIIARRKGGVYIASPAGVHIFDGMSWRLVATRKAAASLAETTDGTLWMNDLDGSLWSLDVHDVWRQHKSPAAIALAASPDGSLWIATENNAVRFPDKTVPGPPLPGRPSTMVVAHDRRVWVATLAGTVHWTSGNDGWHQAQFTPWPRGAFRSMAEDRKGRIWAGAYGGHVAFGNADTPWTVWDVRAGPFQAGIMSLLGDREGSVWFGLNAIGMAQWIGEPWSHRTTIDPSNPVATPIAGFGVARGATPHSLLVAIFQSGFIRLNDDGSVRLFDAKDGITEDVRAAVEAKPGMFIAGTRFGIFEAQPGQPFKQVLKMPGGFVMGLFESPDHTWYAGSSTMGVLIRDANGAWHPADAINRELDNMHVRDMKWRGNELWVATLRGITVFHSNGVEHLNAPQIPESVNAILFDGENVWAGGTGGVAVLRDGRWIRMTDADGVPGQTVYSLGHGKDGAIWAGGSAGVGRYLDGRWRTWDSREGLLQEECNLNGLVVDDDGVVYVATMGGLARFDPKVTTLPPPPLNLRWKTPPAARERALHLS